MPHLPCFSFRLQFFYFGGLQPDGQKQSLGYLESTASPSLSLSPELEVEFDTDGKKGCGL